MVNFVLNFFVLNMGFYVFFLFSECGPVLVVMHG